jgi:hypothetical protein
LTKGTLDSIRSVSGDLHTIESSPPDNFVEAAAITQSGIRSAFF